MTTPVEIAPPAGFPGKHEAAGTVALRQLEAEICGIKRLFVRQRMARGHQRLRLDTIGGKIQAAVALYRSMGFAERPPYYLRPVPDTAYMELVL